MSAFPQVLARRFLVVLFDTSSRRTNKKKSCISPISRTSRRTSETSKEANSRHMLSLCSRTQAPPPPKSRLLLHQARSILGVLAPSCLSYMCVRILLCMCPHTTVYVSAYYCVCVLILLCMCPHTTVYVSAYYCVCVLILLCMCPHTTVYVSSYYCVCVLILLHVSSPTTTYLSSHYYICFCTRRELPVIQKKKKEKMRACARICISLD